MFHRFLGHGLPIHEQVARATFPETGTIELEVEPDCVFAGLEFRAFPGRPLQIEEIVEEDNVAAANAFIRLCSETGRSRQNAHLR